MPSTKKASAANKASTAWKKPTGKYKAVTADKVCASVEDLTLWICQLKAMLDLGNSPLPSGSPRPNGSGSPPPFP